MRHPRLCSHASATSEITCGTSKAWTSSGISGHLNEKCLAENAVGVHNFVLGDPGQARYPLAMASTVSTPAEMAGQSRWKSAPSYQELALLAFTTAAIFLATVTYFRSYESLVRDAGDNGAYIVAASGIHHWKFEGVRTKQFWGYSYVIAGVSAVTRTPERTSLVVVCWICSAVAIGEWIPRDRRLLWATGMVSGLMAGASAIGIRNVIHALWG